MTCKDIRDQLSAFLDGELAMWDRRQVEAHLRGCAECRAAVIALGETIAAVHDGPWVPDDILPTATILARLPEVARQRERAMNRVVLAEAGAGVLAVGVVLWVALSLRPVTLLVQVLAALWRLCYQLALDGSPPWTFAPLLGMGVMGVVAAVLILHGLLVFGGGRR